MQKWNTRKNMRIIVKNRYSSADFTDIEKIEKNSFKDSWKKEEIKTLLLNENYHLIVNEDSNKIISYVIFTAVFDEIEIIRTATDINYRMKKNADKSMDFFIKYSEKKGASKIFLDVGVNNFPAVNLYKKKGFKIINERKKYFKDGENAYMMLLEI